jgi:tyrosine-protein kinase Etk/Wzc
VFLYSFINERFISNRPTKPLSVKMSQHKDDNLLEVIKLLYRWRKHLITTVAIAIVGSIVISLLLPTYYKATTTFLPANPLLKSPNHLFGTSTENPEPTGTEEDLDRMLAIAESKNLTDYVIQRFDLYNHYNIDSTAQKAPYKIKKKLFKLYNIQKNEFGQIELSVEDKDRAFAMEMANAIREKIDLIDQNLMRGSQLKTVKVYELELNSKDEYLRIMKDSLSNLRQQYGIYDIEAQGKFVSQFIPTLQAELSGARQSLIYFKGVGMRDSIRVAEAKVRNFAGKLAAFSGSGEGFNLSTFNEGREKILFIEQFLESYSEQMAEQREMYRRYKSVAEANIPSIYTVEQAYLPVVKSYPIRWLIVAGSTFVAFVLAVMAILILDRYRDVAWNEVLNDK